MSDLLKPVAAQPLCPRTVYAVEPSYRHRPCAQPLTDLKCPTHGLIRELMSR